MATVPYYTLLTALGAAEWSNAQALGKTIALTHLALGDGNGAATTPTEAMTALVREVHRVTISSLSTDPQNPNWLVIEAVIPADIGGFTVREIGLIGGSAPGGANRRRLSSRSAGEPVPKPRASSIRWRDAIETCCGIPRASVHVSARPAARASARMSSSLTMRPP